MASKSAVNSNGVVTNTFGWARSEVVGALINSIFLLALCVTMFIESLKKFGEPEQILEPGKVFVVSLIGLIINVVGIVLFHGNVAG